MTVIQKLCQFVKLCWGLIGERASGQPAYRARSTTEITFYQKTKNHLKKLKLWHKKKIKEYNFFLYVLAP